VNGRMVLAVAAVVAFLGAHLLVIGVAAKLVALPVGLAGGLAALAVAKHLGLLAPMAAWLRRRVRRASIPRS